MRKLEGLVHRSRSVAETSWHVRTALDYSWLWGEAGRYFDRNELMRVRYHSLFQDGEHIAGLGGSLEACKPNLSTHYGMLMFEGMLASTQDRAAAAELFRAARADNPEFAVASYLDSFTATYLTSEEIAAESALVADRRAALSRSFELVGAPLQAGDRGLHLLFSFDPTFFAIYFPYWASVAGYLAERDVGLHFAIAGEEREVMDTIEDGRALAESVWRLRGLDRALLPASLSFSRVTVPDYVNEPVTFYACARYLLAREICTRLGAPMLILDMDMTMVLDPVDFLRELSSASSDRLAIVKASGLESLIPARRSRAGTFLLRPGEVADRAMHHLEDYIFAGLSRPTSWTLDQIALAYAVERVTAEFGSEIFLDIESLRRPFTQESSLTTLYEGAQRRLGVLRTRDG